MRVAVLLMCVGLAGCGASRQAEFQAEMAAKDRARAECGTKRTAGELRTRVDYARCLNAADLPVTNSLIVGNIRVLHAGRVAIAEKIDRGQITEAQGDLELAQLSNSLSQQLQQNILASRAVSAQERAVSNANRSTTCTRFGNSVTCY